MAGLCTGSAAKCVYFVAYPLMLLKWYAMYQHYEAVVSTIVLHFTCSGVCECVLFVYVLCRSIDENSERLTPTCTHTHTHTHTRARIHTHTHFTSYFLSYHQFPGGKKSAIQFQSLLQHVLEFAFLQPVMVVSTTSLPLKLSVGSGPNVVM